MKYLYILFILALLGGGAMYALYNKPHKNVAAAESDFTVAAPALLQAFETNEAEANKKYLDKVVQVKGTIKTISEEEPDSYTITLDAGNDMSGIICTVPKNQLKGPLKYQAGQPITLKGICTGMLMDVVLVKCVIIE